VLRSRRLRLLRGWRPGLCLDPQVHQVRPGRDKFGLGRRVHLLRERKESLTGLLLDRVVPVGVDRMEQASCCMMVLVDSLADVAHSLAGEMEDHRNELLVAGNLVEEKEGRSRVVVVE